MPEGYPTLDALRAGGWLPVPRAAAAVPAASSPPAATIRWRSFERVADAGATTGAAELVDLGEVGHLNPASGYGDWPRADAFIARARAPRTDAPTRRDAPRSQGDRPWPRAIRFHETGGPEVLELETVEVGEPGPGQARVRHTYVAVNFIDIYFRTGRYPLPLPNGLGSDAVGVVEAVGAGVTDIKAGDRVGYLLGPQGAYSDVRVMPADVLIPLPDGVSDRTASTLMMKGMTAQYLFRQVYPLKGGETILYHAAAGGVGLIACQWARALGVTMIGTVSTDEKAEIARAHGCAHTIVTSREDIAKRVREITDGKGVPVVYDSVGKDTLMASLDSLQPRGTLVSNGTSSGPVVIDTHAAGGEGLDLGHAAGDDALRHAARAHAGDGRRAVRPRAGRPHRRRAEAELRAGRRRRGAPRARVAPDHRRDRAGALKGTAMDLHALEKRPGADGYLFGRGPAWFAFAMTLALMIVDYVDRQVIVSLFPYMKADWGLSDKQLGALVSVVSVTVALGALPVALFADRASRVKSIVVDGHGLEPGDDLLHVHAQLRPAARRARRSSASARPATARSARR